MEALNLLDFFVLGCGLYALYAAFVLGRDGTIVKIFLLTKDVDPASCKDLPGFAGCMSPKLRTLGISMLAYSLVALMNTYVVRIGTLFWIMMGVFLVVLFWYGMELKKAVNRYF